MLQHIVPIVFSVLFGGLIFYLLKKKITNIENKVNLMFQLIQEHEKKEQLRNTHQQTSQSKNLESNLIDVSDVSDIDDNSKADNYESGEDCESGQDDESDECNDNITENYDILNNISSPQDSKKIAMDLIAQIDNTMNMANNINKSQSDTESDFDTDSDNESYSSDKLNIQGSLTSLEENKIINLNVENNNTPPENISIAEFKKISNNKNNQDESINATDIPNDQNNNNTQHQDILKNQNNATKEHDTLDEENNNTQECDNLDEVILDDNLDEVTLDDNLDEVTLDDNNINIGKYNTFKKYTVSELKKECSKRNLTGFKSLKKTELIQLLENS